MSAENNSTSLAMNPDNFCRLCAKSFERKLDNDLFAKFNKSLIQQIKDLTGVTLRALSRQKRPRHICPTCKDNLLKAYSFRQAVIKAQTYFKSNHYKEKVGFIVDRDLTTQLFDTVFVSVKEEYDEDEIDTNPAPIEGNQSEDEVDIKTALSFEKLDSEAVDKNVPIPTPCIGDNQSEDEDFFDNVTDKVEVIIKPDIRTDVNLEADNTDAEDDNVEEDPSFEAFSDSGGSDDVYKKKPKKSTKPKVDPDAVAKKKRVRKPREKKIKPPGEKLYKCHHCDLKFKRCTTRVKHERLFHDRDWPFQCEECGKRFTTHEMGVNHMVVHTKIRNFHCEICSASFLLKKHLTTHYRSETHKNNAAKLGLENGVAKIEPTAPAPLAQIPQSLPVPVPAQIPQSLPEILSAQVSQTLPAIVAAQVPQSLPEIFTALGLPK